MGSCASTPAMEPGGPSYEELPAIFKKFNTSGDGYISFEELMNAFNNHLKMEIDAEQAKGCIAEVDLNADGRIELSEFLKIFHLAPEKRSLGARYIVEVSEVLWTPALPLVHGEAVIQAARRGLEDLKAQLAAGNDIDAKDSWGQTTLTCLSRTGETDAVKALLAAGANVNARDKWGQTALDYAREHRHFSVIEILEAAGARGGVRKECDPGDFDFMTMK